MTDKDAKRLAVLIESHWPRPEFTDVDVAVMAQAMRAHGVTYEEAVDAVNRVVWAGETFQPRAPQLMPLVRTARRLATPARNEIDSPKDVVGAKQYRDLLARLRGNMKGV